MSSFRYVRAQIEHLPGKTQWPRSGHMPDILRAFVISTQQLYEGTINLISDKRPTAFVLPAAVVTRALVEGLGNLLALVEDPVASVPLFMRDDYLHMHLKTKYNGQRFPKRAPYAKEVIKLQQYADGMGLTAAELADPEKHLGRWPTPGRLLTQTKAPRLTGDRRKVFKEIYDFWYGTLSGYAHHRLTALQLALFADEQFAEETFLMIRSVTAFLATQASLCVLSEVEHAAGIPVCTHLRAAWERFRDMDDITQSVYSMRYATLLGMTSTP
jgi:hypothetical protein